MTVEQQTKRMRDKIIVRVVTKALIPFILLFALYVQFHGDYGPGGGFQAGVIFAAGLVLYGLVFGLSVLTRAVPVVAIETVMALGVLLFGGVGAISMLDGAPFLDYTSLDHHDPKHAQHVGILLVEGGRRPDRDGHPAGHLLRHCRPAEALTYPCSASGTTGR